MKPLGRIFSIAFVFGCVSIAWLILGGITTERTSRQSRDLRDNVSELWGSPQTQVAPQLHFHWETERTVVEEVEQDGRTQKISKVVVDHHSRKIDFDSTKIDVGLSLDQRLKGLMWYSLYDVGFEGHWVYLHDRPEAGRVQIAFRFPDANGIYDAFRFVVNGESLELTPNDGEVSTMVDVAPGQEVQLAITYQSRGLDQWSYQPAQGVARLSNFHATMTTDFSDIDFPPYSMSPSSKAESENGWSLDWAFEQVVTGHQIGMIMPEQIQPGELASSLSFSAPISLLFFFLLIAVLAALRKIDIHPINYFFIGGAFFAFHLLFAYSVDMLSVIPAFCLASAISVALVVSYLRLVVSDRFAFVEAGLAQLVYLVGFSLAHFWDGFTGLTVTILSIATLFILMQLTGRIRWTEVFAGSSGGAVSKTD